HPGDDAAGRAVARRGMELHRLGRDAGRRPCGGAGPWPQPQARGPAAAGALHFVGGMLRFDHWSAFDVQGGLILPLLIAGGAVLHHLSPLCIAKLPRRRLGLFLGTATGVLLMLDLVVLSPNKVFIYFKF